MFVSSQKSFQVSLAEEVAALIKSMVDKIAEGENAQANAPREVPSPQNQPAFVAELIQMNKERKEWEDFAQGGNYSHSTQSDYEHLF